MSRGTWRSPGVEGERGIGISLLESLGIRLLILIIVLLFGGGLLFAGLLGWLVS